MPISNPKQLLSDVATHIDFVRFFNVCVSDLIQRVVEKSGAILAKPSRNRFLPSEIALMKNCKLREIKFGYPAVKSEFRIEFGDKGKFIAFSNLNSPNNELRGEVLRKALTALSEDYPEMTLYDALNNLLQRPEFVVASFLNDMATATNYPQIGSEGEYHQETKKALIKLSIACIDYIKKKSAEGIMFAKSLGVVKNFLTLEEEKMMRVVSLAFSDASSDEVFSALREEIITSETIKKDLDWIEKLYHLASKYPHNSRRIKELALVAETLLEFRTNPEKVLNSNKDIGTQVKKFNDLLKQVRELPVNDSIVGYLKSLMFHVPTMDEEIADPPKMLQEVLDEIRGPVSPGEEESNV